MKHFTLLILLSCSSVSIGQVLFGTIKLAKDSSIINFTAQIIIESGQHPDTIYSNNDGTFSLNLVKGRYNIEIDRVGYQKYSEIIELSSDMNISVYLLEGEILEEVEVSYLTNSFSRRGMTTLSRKDFNILPASFDDPTRLLMKYQAMSTANDQANSVIFRGLPSHYISWSLNDVMIVNPNHTSNAGTISDLGSSTSGGTNMVGGQMIDNATFASSADRSTFNTLSGINNLETSTINKYFQVSFLGIEAGYQFRDFSVGYRYSFTGLLADMGVDFGGEEIRFQDINLRFHPSLKKGKLVGSFIFGNSSNVFKKFDDPATIKEYQDIDYSSGNLIATLAYSRDKFSVAMGYSNRKDERTAMGLITNPDLTFMDDYSNHRKRYFTKFNYEINTHAALGVHVLGDQYDALNLFRQNNAATDDFVWNVSPFISWKKLWRKIELQASLNPTYRFAYDEFSPDSKLGATIQIGSNQNVGMDVQHVSMSQPAFVHLYSPMSQDLRSTKSVNFNINYNYRLRQNGVFEIQAFYHSLYDVPVTSQGLSAFNTIDLPPRTGEQFVLTDNARVKGLSMQYELDRNKWWVNINASYFSSQYKFENSWFSSTQDFGHTFNTTIGRIWSFTNNSKFLRVGISFHHRGGAPIYPLQEGELLTDYNYQNGPDGQLANYWRIDGRISYNKLNNIWSLDIQNISGRLNDAYYYRDLPFFDQTLQTQLGLIPVLSYRKMF